MALRFKIVFLILVGIVVSLTNFSVGNAGQIVNWKASRSNLVDIKGGLTAGALSRVSAATYIDTNGVLQTSWGDRNQLIPTNAQEDPNNQSQNNMTIGSSDTPPTGVSSATALLETTDNGQHRTYIGSLSVAAGTTYAISVYFKGNGRTRFAIRETIYDGSENLSYFDSSTPEVLAGGDAAHVSSIETVGDYVRASVILTCQTTDATRSVYINLVNTGTTTIYVGDTSKGATITGLMLEELPSGNTIGSDLFDQEALGSELVTNGGFDSDSDWTKGTGWTIGSGKASVNDPGSSQAIRQDISAAQGTIYRIDFEITDYTDGQFDINLGNGTYSGTYSSVGTYTLYKICDGADGQIRIRANSTATLSIDNVSVKAVTTPAKGEFTYPAIMGSEAITAQNDRDFSSGTIGNWTVSADGAGTATYDATNLNYPGESGDDKQGLLTSSGDTGLYGYLATADDMTISANTLYKFSAKVAVPAANTLKTARIRFNNLDGNTNFDTALSDDTWTTVTAYRYIGSDVTGNIGVGFGGDPADGDLLYFDDISIRPVQISWVPYGTNTIKIDETENAMYITYVDNGNGAYLTLRDTTDLSSDLTIGQEYLLSGRAKVGTGDSVAIRVYDGSGNSDITITSDSFTNFSLVFTAYATAGCQLKFVSMGAGEEIWIDNLTIKAIPPLSLLEPSDYVNSATIPAKARFESDGLLLEGEATNLLEYSEDFSQWAATRVTATTTTTGPDGSTTSARILVGTGTAGAGYISYDPDPLSIADNTNHALSVFIKAGARTWVALNQRTKGGTNNITYFDIANVAVGATDGSDDSGIELIGNGWVRVWVMNNVGSGSEFSLNQIYAADADNDLTLAGNTDNLISVYGAQLEATPYPTSYIPTDGNQVTRTTEAGANGVSGYSWTMSTALKNALGDGTSNGTLIVEWMPGYDVNATNANAGIISAQNAIASILSHGFDSFKTYDGTNTLTHSTAVSNTTPYLIAVRWHEANSDLAISMKATGGNWSHEAATDYDGSFTLGTLLWLHYGNEYPAHIAAIYMYDTYLTDGQVESEIWNGSTLFPIFPIWMK